MASPAAEPTSPDAVPPQPAAAPARRRKQGRLVSAAFWLGLLGLLGANGWKYYLDQQPDPNPRKAEALLDADRLDEAEPMLGEILRRSPHDGSARILMARLYTKRGDLIRAGEEFARVPSWWPGKPRALFLQGEAYNQAKLARRAEAAWLACALDDPLHPAPELYYLTAVEAVIEIFAMQERWEEAREVAWSCYDRVPPDQRKFVVFMILRTYVQRLAPDVRAQRLREFVAADPEDFESRLALARAEFGLGNTAEARSQVDECLALRPESARAWGTLLGMLKDLGDWEALAAEVAKVPSSCDGDAEIMGFRGLAAERSGDLKRAAELYGEEIELAPFSDEAHYRLALVQRRLGLKDEAARNLARSKELREAGGSLLGAYEAYSNARIAKVPDPELLRQTADRLAAVCRKLGWMRIAGVL